MNRNRRVKVASLSLAAGMLVTSTAVAVQATPIAGGTAMVSVSEETVTADTYSTISGVNQALADMLSDTTTVGSVSENETEAVAAKEETKKETKKSETKKPETKKSETKKSETQKTETQEPVTKETETQETETQEPITEETETQEPVTEETETQEPETDATEPPAPKDDMIIIKANGTIYEMDASKGTATFKLEGGGQIELDVTDSAIPSGYLPQLGDEVSISYDKSDMKLLDIQLVYRPGDEG